MWNNWQHLSQVKGFQRLALALCLSFLLHLVLLGKLGFNLPDLRDSQHVIDARLLVENSQPANQKVAPASSKAVPDKHAPLKPMPEPRLPSVPVTAESVLPSQATSNMISDATPLIEPVPPIVHDSPVESIQPDDLRDESRLTINHNAYKYVETEFDVRTELDARVDASPAGKAKMIYQLLPNGEQYQLTSLIQANGLLALFMPDLLQTSDGFLTNTGLRPQHYLYQFGDRKNKTYRATFDWENKKLQLNSATGVSEAVLVDGVQDLLSFMYQFMFIPPLQNMHLSITNGKKLGSYDYGFEGEETISTKMGNLSTIHIVRTTSEGDEKTELWLALDYQYVPVKIRKTEKEGKVYELLATSLKTEKPASQPE